MNGPLLALAATLLSASQDFGSLDEVRSPSKQYVAYAAEQQVIPIGKVSMLELRFRVEDGFHINSHNPRSELLVATRVEVQPNPGVKLAGAQYPVGKAYSFRFAPREKLDVYTGDFTVKLPVVATAGTHELKGELRYQACNQAACYPVRTLPLQVILTAK